MRGVGIVLVKEVLDNLRDRQTLFYALLFGPVLLPLLLGGALVASVQQLSIDFDEVTELAVDGAALAPNLIAFLHRNNVDAVPAPAAGDIVRAVRLGEVPLVLSIDARFEEALRAGRPAPLTLHVDESDKASSKAARRVGALLDAYGRTLNVLRLQHRGIDPALFDSLDVIVDDVSSEGAGGQMLASLLPFLFIMSMVMGGFYLAIDTTAGERERRSLEPLLTLPLARRDIVLGKFGATLLFVALSVLLTATSVWVLFRLFPLDALGGQIRFDAPTVARALALAAPLAPFVAALLIAVSAFTRSTKEAQTYLGLLMVVPMAPFFVLQFLSIRPSAGAVSVPMLGQYLLLEQATLGERVPPLFAALSVAGTLAAALALLALACRLYARERVLG